MDRIIYIDDKAEYYKDIIRIVGISEGDIRGTCEDCKYNSDAHCDKDYIRFSRGYCSSWGKI